MKTAEESLKEKIFYERSCFKCAHLGVCYYYRATAQIVAIRDEETEKQFQPFKPEEIARICRFYSPDLV